MSDEDIVEGREIADLLPFYANGTLRGPDKARVAVALAADPALQRELGLILEERRVVTEANESLAGSSRVARDRFLALLDEQPTKQAPSRFDVAGWLAARLEGLQPRTLAWSSLAAAVLVAIQAGAIGLITTHGPSPKATYETASVSTQPASGVLVVVGFAADAKAADIATLLTAMDATIIAGPMPGGLYQIRVGRKPANPAEMEAIVGRLKAASTLVRFAAPSGAGD